MKHLLKLRTFIRPYVWLITLNLVILLLITGLALVVPGIIRGIIDNGLKAGASAYLVRAALILLVLGLVTAALTLFQRYLSEWVAAHIGYDLRTRMYDKLQHLSFSYHDHAQTGQLISRCIEDVRAIQGFASGSIIEIIQLAFMSIGVVTLLFIDNPGLAVIALLPLIPMAFMTVDFGGRVTRLFYAVDNALGDLSSRLQENVTGIQVVRAFAREKYEIGRFDDTNRIYFQSRIRVIREWSKVMPTTNLLIVMGTILVLWFGGQMVMVGRMTVGELVAFNAYLLMLSAPVQQLAWLVNAAGEASAGAQRVFEVLEADPEIAAPLNPLRLESPKGKVEFRDVSLIYRDDVKEALSGVNLVIEPNQMVALIGPTGAGKTSLVNLIPRFYDVSSGMVLVDGQDVRTYDPVELRKHIGVVLQSSLLFSDSIRENIAYGRPGATMDEIVDAARAAQAHDFITGFPDGYGTVLGERGVTLSGGQRQRIAIARALLIDPRILILDDSTASVDTRTEQTLQTALKLLMRGRTTFVIAHRLATVRHADLILVMEKGRIIQRGTHDSLLAEGGLYREIHDTQLNQISDSPEELEAQEQLVRERDGLKNRRSADRTFG
jgi:ATP-binding cassette, subfamily B, multidrug efflux pump